MSDTNAYDDPRIAALYDLESPPGADSEFYVTLASDLAATRIVDIGCGTGALACELAHRSCAVVGVDPADAMLAVARSRPEGSQVRWVHGDASRLSAHGADLVVMTGHAAQEIIADEDWEMTLAAAHRALRIGGHLAFESRNPQLRPWEAWTPDRTLSRLEHPTLGVVDVWYRLLGVEGDLVRFEAHNRFASSGEDVAVVGELRFQSGTAIERSLAAAGFEVDDVFGDWQSGPVALDSPELTFVARTR